LGRYSIRHFISQLLSRTARANEAKGQSGAAFRHHLISKFGLTPGELQQITRIALTYTTNAAPLFLQQHQVSETFKQSIASNSLPATSRTALESTRSASGQEHSYIAVPRHAVLLEVRSQLHAIHQQIVGFGCPQLTPGTGRKRLTAKTNGN